MSKRLPVKRIERIKKHKYILEKIARAKTAERKKLVMQAPAIFFKVIQDLCMIIDSGILETAGNHHSTTIRKVARGNSKSIKGMLKQKGGLIGSIIAGALPFLAPLFAKLFK